MSKFFCCRNKNIFVLFITIIFLINFTTITVNASEDSPNLKLNVHLPLPTFIEGQESEIIVDVENGGDTNVSVGKNISVKLKIDSKYVSKNSSEKGLPARSSTFVNLSWTPTFNFTGKHNLIFELYYEGDFIGPPVEIKDIVVFERDSELEIVNIKIPENIVVNETAMVQASIINKGKDTKSSIYANLSSSEEGWIDTVIKSSPLPRDETYEFFFNWTPTHFGSQILTVYIVYNSTIHDSVEKTVVVDIEQLEWWDDNWHYRYFLSINGSGNISKSFNFSELLNHLNVNGEFENNTIRIVEYDQSGNSINVVTYYEFKESQDYNNISNAKGILTWKAIGDSFEKFYCIYFDVTDNLGDRDELAETPGMSASGNATIGHLSLVNGWCINSLQPANGSYCLIEDFINIIATTNAKAENITAFIFFNDNESHNFTKNLSNIGDYTLWSYKNISFDLEGNWTIQITARDWAGYTPEILEHSFFVGKLDINAINLTFSTNWPPTSPTIYRNDTVDITALVICNDANIEDVEVSLKIKSDGFLTVHKDKTSIDLIKGEKKYVTFSWNANISGEFTVIVTVDPNDEIDEEDETNNELLEIISVYEWPDLAVVGIILPSEEKTEFDRVQIDVVIKNIGLADAKDYEVRLFIEQDIMTYSNEIDSKLVSADMKSSITLSLFWDSAITGQWIVGAQVNYSDTKRDTNILNNWFSANNLLTIRGIERYPPIIIIENVSRKKEQGETVEITATITDSSRIESVTIKVADPRNTSYTNTMVRTTDNIFKYNFENTFEDGEYTFTITAIDLTIHRNKGIVVGSFIILEDSTKPVVSYYIAEPYVQLKGKDVNFYCIASDNVGIKSVEIEIEIPVVPPDTETNIMEKISGEKFEFTNNYEKSGKYSYYVTVNDYTRGKTTTSMKTFWITSNSNDIDDDGMPDSWERKYGLNPEDPDDSYLDLDKDGMSNLEEYKAGTNPTKDIFIENVAFRVRDNIYYLIGSIILFLIVVIIPYIDKWRKSR